MNPANDSHTPHVEVDDAAAAFRRTEDLTRRALSIPKKDAGAKPKKGGTKKQSRRR